MWKILSSKTPKGSNRLKLALRHAANAIGNLKGSPKEVQHFSALGTGLKSFEGCPEIVHGDFDFSNLKMNIEDFDFTHFPKHVGGMISMWFANNHLKCDKTNYKQMIISHCGNSNIVI